MDPELASEMVKLLAQELKVVRAQLHEAESAGGPSIRLTQQLTAENDSLKADNAALQQRVARLQNEVRHVSSMKSEEDVEMVSRMNGEFARLLIENKDLIHEKEEASRNQDKLSILQEKYKRTKSKVHEYNEILNGLRVELSDYTQELEQLRKTAVSEIDFRGFLNDLPYKVVEGQLELSSIPPLNHTKIYKNIGDVCKGPYFINPNEVIWSPSGIALGIIIKPAFQYNPKTHGGTWTKFKDNFEIGKQMDVCYLSGKTTRYLGTYERVGGQETMVIAPKVLKYLDHEKLNYVSKCTTLFPDLVPPSQTCMIRNMYKQGVIKVQCFGIRCVAFNQAFAGKLQEINKSSAEQSVPDNAAITSPAITSRDVRKRKGGPKSQIQNRNKRRYGPFSDESDDLNNTVFFNI